MKSVIFWILGVGFSISLAGCDDSKSPKKPGVPPVSEKSKVIETRESGVMDCETRDRLPEITPDPTKVQTVVIEARAQKVMTLLCNGSHQVHSEIPAVAAKLSGPIMEANFVEVYNETTCSRRRYQAGSEFLNYKNLGELERVDLGVVGELKPMAVLPIGKQVPPVDSYRGDIVLDPMRVNVLKVRYMDCNIRSISPAMCDSGRLLEEQVHLISVSHNGLHHRGARLEKEKCE